MNHSLVLEHVNATISNSFMLKDINLVLEKGTIMGLVGKNGSGKTSLLKVIMNCLTRDSGNILYSGFLYHENQIAVKQKLGCVFDQLPFGLTCKPRSILNVLRPFYPDFDMAFYTRYMSQFGLDETQKLTSYSLGMQKQFQCIITLACNPDILLLDEPTASLDPTARVAILDMLLDFMQDENKSILFSTHITSDLDKIADYITIINYGRIVASKEKEALLEDYLIVQITKDCLSQELAKEVIGLKEKSFFYEGLLPMTKLNAFDSNTIKMHRPNIEDLMQYIDIIHKGGESL